MEKEIKKFAKGLNIITSVYADKKKRNELSCDKLRICGDFIYYFFNSKKAKNRSNFFYSDPDTDTAISVNYIKNVFFYYKIL